MKRSYVTCMSCKHYGTWLDWLINWFRERFYSNRSYLRNREMKCRLDGYRYRSMTKACRYWKFHQAGRR